MTEQGDLLPGKVITKDSLFDGDLTCFQHAAGYRFSIDAVLVAHFVEVRQNERILDLGCGCGIIMLILLYRWEQRLQEIIGIEIQEGLSGLAGKNLAVNNMTEKGRVITGDIRKVFELIPAETFDTVVCNPPFYTTGSGRQCDNEEARLARHQCLATLEDYLSAAAFAVRNRGSVYAIYPAEQLARFITVAGRHQLEIKKLQFIYGYPQEKGEARLVVLHCLKNGGHGVKVLPPFYIYQGKNKPFSSEMQKLYSKNAVL